MEFQHRRPHTLVHILGSDLQAGGTVLPHRGDPGAAVAVGMARVGGIINQIGRQKLMTKALSSGHGARKGQQKKKNRHLVIVSGQSGISI